MMAACNVCVYKSWGNNGVCLHVQTMWGKCVVPACARHGAKVHSVCVSESWGGDAFCLHMPIVGQSGMCLHVHTRGQICLERWGESPHDMCSIMWS